MWIFFNDVVGSKVSIQMQNSTLGVLLERFLSWYKYIEREEVP